MTVLARPPETVCPHCRKREASLVCSTCKTSKINGDSPEHDAKGRKTTPVSTERCESPPINAAPGGGIQPVDTREYAASARDYGSMPSRTPTSIQAVPVAAPLNADPQELPAAASLAATRLSGPTGPGQSEMRNHETSAQYPAVSAPINAVREADARPVAAESCTDINERSYP